MKIELWLIVKNETHYIEAFEMFAKRISRYSSFEVKYFEPQKKGNAEAGKKAEAKIILSKLDAKDHLIILDENGKQFSSEKFAEKLNSLLTGGNKKVVFFIGSAYGIDEQLQQRAQQKLSLSQLTFSHQLVRLIFLEQLYRAFTILKNEPYHHA